MLRHFSSLSGLMQRHLMLAIFAVAFAIPFPLLDGVERLPEQNGVIHVPISPSTSGTGWILLDGYQIVSYGFTKTSPNQTSAIPFSPKRYGDIVHMLEYRDVSLENFVYIVGIFSHANQLKMGSDSSGGTAEKAVLSEKHPPEIITAGEQLAITMLCKDIFWELSPDDRAKSSDLPNNTKARINSTTKQTISACIASLSSDAPMNPMPAQAKTFTARSFTNRGKWSATSILVGLAYLPKHGETTPSAQITLFPARIFNASERMAILDNLSLDIGAVKKIDQLMEDDFGLSAGLGITLGDGAEYIHFSAGIVRYDDLSGDDTDDFFLSANIDLSELINALSK